MSETPVRYESTTEDRTSRGNTVIITDTGKRLKSSDYWGYAILRNSGVPRGNLLEVHHLIACADDPSQNVDILMSWGGNDAGLSITSDALKSLWTAIANGDRVWKAADHNSGAE